MKPGYNYFSEGSRTAINETKLFGNCKTSRVHVCEFCDNGSMATGYEGKVKKILHFIFENEVYSWTTASTCH
jgi:hypothetical protein